MARVGAEVTGLDMGKEPLEGRTSPLTGNRYSCHLYTRCTVENHAAEYPQRYDDVVTCMEMLEHVPDPSSIVRSCAKLVKPGGHVFFSTINRNKKRGLCWW